MLTMCRKLGFDVTIDPKEAELAIVSLDLAALHRPLIPV
jgi:hypothetical protein